MIETICESMMRIGEKLKADPTRTEGLRQLQDELSAFLIGREHDADSRFLAFFLDVLVGDYFRNLAGDLPYSRRTDDLRHEGAKCIGEDLQGLAGACRDHDSAALYTAYRTLAVDYMKVLDQVGDALEGRNGLA